MLSAVDDLGRTISFSYYETTNEADGNQWDLKEVVVTPGSAMSGPERRWTYTYYKGTSRNKNNLKSITDPNRNVILTNYYSDIEPDEDDQNPFGYDAVVRQDYGGERYDYVYLEEPAGEFGLDNQRCVVIVNRSGQVRMLTFPVDLGKHELQNRYDFAGIVTDRAAFLTGLPATRAGSITAARSAVVNLLRTPSIASRTRTDDPNYPNYWYTRNVNEYITVLPESSSFWVPSTVASGDALSSGGGESYTYADDFPGLPADDQNNGLLMSRVRQRGSESGEFHAPTSHPDHVGGSGDYIHESWRYDANGAGGGGCPCADRMATGHLLGDANNPNRSAVEHDYDSRGNRIMTRRGETDADMLTANGLNIFETFSYYTVETPQGMTHPPLGALYEHVHPSHGGTAPRVDRFNYYPVDHSNAGARGMLSERIDNLGGGSESVITQFEYDPLGNVSRRTVRLANSATVEREWSYQYNAYGWLVLSEERNPSTGVPLAKTGYTYDANGNLLREDVFNFDHTGGLTKPGGTITNTRFTTIHDYDVLDRPVRTCREESQIESPTLPDTQITCKPAGGLDLTLDARFVTEEFSYDPNGNLTLIKRGASASAGGNQPGHTIRREYDERNLVFLEIKGEGTANEVRTRFDYDNNKRLRTRYDAYRDAGASSAGPDEQQTRVWHDTFGRLIEVLDPMGNKRRWSHNNVNQMTASWSEGAPSVDSLGETGNHMLSYAKTSYDSAQRVVEVRRYVFAPYSITEETIPALPVPSPSDTIEQYEYYANSDLLKETRRVDPVNSAVLERTTYEYDGLHRVKRVIGAEGDTVEYTYDATDDVLSVTETEYPGDGSGSASGTAQVFTQTFAYDALDRMTTATDGKGNSRTYQHDSRGNIVLMRDARSNDTIYEYDALSRLVKTIRVMCPGGSGCVLADPMPDADDIVTQQVWDKSSRLVAQIDDNNNRTSYWYDESDRLMLTRMGDGTLHGVGNGLVTWADPLQPPSFTTGWHSGYDDRGNPTLIFDANGSLIANIYDAADRLTGRTIAPGAGGSPPDGGYPVAGSDNGVPGIEAEYYTFDGLSRILVASDEDTRVTRAYDSLSRLTSETSEIAVWQTTAWQSFPAWSGSTPPTTTGAKTVTYQYDVRSNVTQVTYPIGTGTGSTSRVVTQEFDPLNRVKRILDGAGGAAPMIAEYSYIGPGRVLNRLHANDTQIDYTWTGYQGGPSGAGFKQVATTESRRTAAPGVVLDSRSYGWDSAQNKTNYTNFIAASGPSRVFLYDAASRMIQSQDLAGNDWTTYSLDGVHNRTDVTGSLIAGAQVGAYDMTLGVAPFDFETNQYSGTPMDRPEYDLNGNLAALYAQAGGELLMMTGLQQGGPGGALQQSINDDIAAGGQWADLTSDESIGVDDIDLFGQFLEAQQALGSGGEGGGEGGTAGLEGCGENDPNCTFYQHVASIAYDYRNQMVEYTDLDNLRTHRYHYDCFGRRVAKVVDHGLSTAKTTRFIYGGQASWQVLAEYDAFQPGTNVPATASYAYGNYIDEPIQMRRDFDGVGPQTTKDFYYHQDELFNVVAITAGQNGTTLPRHTGVYNTGDVIERIKYGDYGNPTVMQGASGTIAFTSLVGNRFMFTGREYDGELGWSYYRTRYMEPEWGRFTTRDTIGTWGDAGNVGNAVAFIDSQPIQRADPFGLASSVTTPAGVIQAIIASLPSSWTTVQIVNYLRMLGFSNELIGQALSMSAAAVAAVATLEVIEQLNCEMLQQVVNKVCKESGKFAKCNNRSTCEELQKGYHQRTACALARRITLRKCGARLPSKGESIQGHRDEIVTQGDAAANCYSLASSKDCQWTKDTPYTNPYMSQSSASGSGCN